ncbi:MAG TPA: PQQ-binding-like beta-propeller repeat protein [Acidimicrobiales bacterium]|nr:PQQ-binding-like beta-propeller repeat protein [Acidimicrobiales bacterium]
MTQHAGTQDRTAARASTLRPRLHQVVSLVGRGAPWRSVAAICLIGVATSTMGLSSSGALQAAQTVDVAHSVGVAEVWGDALPDNGGPIALSSPNIADLPGGTAVVVGDRAGHVYALSLATGNQEWAAGTGGIPVDSTPSVSGGSIFVGVGNASNSAVGGYMGISATGGTEWMTHVQNPPTDRSPATAVVGGLAVGNLEGGTDVVSGSLGEETQALDAANGAILPGFPWFQADSNFTTPALADLYSNGRTEIVEGGDSSAGFAYGQSYGNGGHLRILTSTGNAMTGNPAGGLLCEYNTDQTVQSSPAVGEFLSGSGVGIAFGTGSTFGGASTTNDLIAVNTHCGAQWIAKLDGSTASSPALADVLGNGQLQVIEGTNNGTVWALNGTNGAALWHTPVGGQIFGSVVTANLGGGYQDVIVPTTLGIQILDGRTGQIVASFAQAFGFQNSPLVTDDANGSVGITVAGYNSSNQGIVEHFEVLESKGSGVNGAGAWPMFHHDPQLTGDAGTPPVNLQVPCNAPAGGPVGYEMTASDGGVFAFGNMPFCGSTGNYPLTAPIVAIASTHDGGGYWTVASDGGMFAFGDAGFYGSMGGHPLTRPIVGMAATPDGKGYWLVASDGGMFAFGDAHFFGSMGGHRLNKAIVGMAPDDATGGYWLVASDGGIFAFNAPFLGSTGSVRLTRPVVGMQALANGRGYRFVASDGGIFSFGAPFYGSTGGAPLVRPVVGIAGF